MKAAIHANTTTTRPSGPAPMAGSRSSAKVWTAASAKSGMPMVSGKKRRLRRPAHRRINRVGGDQCETEAEKRRAAKPHGAGAPGVRQSDNEHGERDQYEDERLGQPAVAIARHRDEEIGLGELAEHETEHQRRAASRSAP